METELGFNSVDEAAKYNSSFDDYPRFEDDGVARASAKNDFLSNATYSPGYIYPRLNNIYDSPEDVTKTPLSVRKGMMRAAIIYLESAKWAGEYTEDELELYAAYHETRLKRVHLIEAASILHSTASSSEKEVARDSFNALNEALYGPMDAEIWQGIMHTEFNRVRNVGAADARTQKIQSDLLDYLGKFKNSAPESPLCAPEVLTKVRDYIFKRYGSIFDVVPNTPEDVYYDAEACQDIMSQALVAGGLAREGWTIKINPKKSVPGTNAVTKIISLPPSTRRNASELRRLIVHEQEVHARRGFNAEMTRITMLKLGTAEYVDAEEGLGVFLECALEGNFENQSFDRARDRYITAGLALGTDGTPRDARQTYETLWRMLALRNSTDGTLTDKTIHDAKALAYGHVENAFRGTNFAMQGVIYRKLKIYYEGLRANADYFSANIDDLDKTFEIALLGKYNHINQDERNRIIHIVPNTQSI